MRRRTRKKAWPPSSKNENRSSKVGRAKGLYENCPESTDTVVVEGNHYFPLTSVNPAFLKPSTTTSVCSWKGNANYYTLEVNGSNNTGVVWYYAELKDAAKQIRGRVASCKGVQVAPWRHIRSHSLRQRAGVYRSRAAGVAGYCGG
ncbi:MAG: DUF427 domain-containing protein [Burkholderiales bacterium]|nr:DUF427 domain-containing protein [Burkholderiales bacterium]